MADKAIFEGTQQKSKKRTRAPLSEEQKQVLRDRLKKAREAKNAKNGKAPAAKKKKEEPKQSVEEQFDEIYNKEKARIEEVPVQEPIATAPPPAKRVPKAKAKAAPRRDTGFRKRQQEIEDLREELEIQRLKNDLEDLKRRKPKLEVIEEKEESKVETPGPVKREEVKVKPVSNVPIPEPTVAGPIRHSLVPKNIWASF